MKEVLQTADLSCESGFDLIGAEELVPSTAKNLVFIGAGFLLLGVAFLLERDTSAWGPLFKRRREVADPAMLE